MGAVGDAPTLFYSFVLSDEAFPVKMASENLQLKDLQFTYQIMISPFRLLRKMGRYLRLVSLFILPLKQLLLRILMGIFLKHIRC